jgi:hypothetical protein
MTEKSLEFAREIYFDNRKSRLFIKEGQEAPHIEFHIVCASRNVKNNPSILSFATHEGWRIITTLLIFYR